jgi:hypothetical protein
MFCLIAVLILGLSQVYKNRPATEATTSAILLPRAPADGAAGGGKARAEISAVPGPSGQATFRVNEAQMKTLADVKQRLESLSPASVVIQVDTRTPPDPLTVTLRLLNLARTLGIPAHIAYRQEAVEGGAS